MQIDAQIRGIEQIKIRNDALFRDLETELRQAVGEQALETRGDWRAAAPVFTGALREGIVRRRSRTPFEIASIVKATAQHSWLVAHGRRPGKMPSVDPRRASNPKSAQRLIDWAKAHGIEPFVLARAIARKGTQAHPFVSVGRAQQAFELRIRGAVDRVLARHRA